MKPLRYEPFIANGSVCFQKTQFHFIVISNHESRWLTALVMSHTLLGDKKGLIIETLFKEGMDKHTGQQLTLGIWKNGAESYRSGSRVHSDF